MPRDSNWNTATVSRLLEQLVRLGVVERQRRRCRAAPRRPSARRALIALTAQSMIVSVRRPRKSNLTRPTASTSSLSNCVTTPPPPASQNSGAKSRQRAGCDHHAAGVLAGVAGEVLELQREVDQFGDVLVGLVESLEFADRRVRVPCATSPNGRARRSSAMSSGTLRDQFGDAVDLAVRHAEHAAGVAQHRLRRHRAVGDDLADPVAAVLARDVVDHLVAAVHAEVDVEVGHRHAFGIEEALEQQVVAQRIEIGDARARRRPAIRRPSRVRGRPGCRAAWPS